MTTRPCFSLALLPLFLIAPARAEEGGFPSLVSLYREPVMTTRACFSPALLPPFLIDPARAEEPAKPAETPAPAQADAPTVVAQAAPTAPTAAASDADAGATRVLEKVVVTAQKRSEDVQDVPVSITVISGKELQVEQIANYEDLSRAVPGVSFNAGYANEGLTNIVIRGISATGGSSTVGLYLDDVSIATKNFYDPGSVMPRFLDFQSVEILRGPQGTLYGDSSEGGTIRFIATPPHMYDFGGEAQADFSWTQHGGPNYDTTGILNLPLSPGVAAVRASVYASSDSGWIDRYADNTNFPQESAQSQGELISKGVNRASDLTIHLLGKITPGGGWTITPAYFYQLAQTSDSAAFYPPLGLYNQNKEVQEPAHDKFDLFSLAVKKDFEDFDFTSITGIFHRDFQRQEDGTFFNSTAFAEFFLDPLLPQIFPNNVAQQQQFQTLDDTVIANLPSTVHFHTNYRQFSQELRLSSSEESKSPLKWVGGLYYAQQTIHNTDFQQIPGIDTTFTKIYGYSLENSLVETTYGAPGLTLFPNDIDESDNRTYNERDFAVFGQADYDLTDAWHIGLGARYTWTNENFNSTEIGFYQIGNISPYYQQATFHVITPKITLRYDISPDNNVYASSGEGFRSGGPTGPIVFGPTSVCNQDFMNIGQTSQPISFQSDSLWTTELGSKNRFFDNQVEANGALFYTKWNNIQQQIYLPICGYYFTANVGDARIYGGELEAAYRVTSELRLTLALSAQSATIVKSNYPLVIAPGAHVIDVPDLTLDLGVAHSTPVFSDFIMTSRANFLFTGHSYGSYQTYNSNYNNPAYPVWNLSVMIENKQYQFMAYAKNAFNNQTIIQKPEINTVFEGYTVRPRTIGVQATLKF
jgi:iron complex outermembrane receptor protein